ncbi:YceI [Polaribacter irgensii 23-P]|uniref:YceI n=1 Tax=Polaribacter irgensii 23-P TaxID=313594 RepID=A4BX84_9FLAO|nr:YceI family protein [Polaribacter irgensii]EAR13575.1 YceI [Polaribacter irgensii 23-P]
MLKTIRNVGMLIILSTFSCLSQEMVQKKTATTVTFTIRNFGFNVAGLFKEVAISSNLKSANAKELFFNAVLRVNSIFTDSDARDTHLLAPDYFDAEKYPKIVFESTAVEKISPSKYVLKGVLTIKGVDKIVETFLEIESSKSENIFLANFALDRRDFGVGGSSLVLSDNVNIKMKYVTGKN